jgi:hypothetical protein
MRLTKGLLFGIALAIILTLLAPKAAHAVAATLVQVVNTSANPVPNLDTERNARVPYESSQQASGNCPSVNGPQQCTYFFLQAPIGYRLVVQNVSGFITLAGNATSPPIALLYDEDNTARLTFWSFSGVLGQTLNGTTQTSFNYPAQAVFDSSDSAPVLTVTANFQASIPQYMTLTGYLENCAVASCPPKIH